MGSSKLKEDLNNCLINFDRRVLITELLDDYQMAYEEVSNIVQNFVKQQEKKDKLKFDKRYIVHGVQEDEYKKEIYKVVNENKLKECLKKLKNSQSSLYSVEVVGGAKSAAPVFKPMSVEKGVKLRTRQHTKANAANGPSETTLEKQETEQANASKNHKVTPPQSIKSTTKVEASVKKTSPKTKTSPTDGKTTEKKSANKKSINNFFVSTTTVSKKSEDTNDSKSATGVSKSPLPKKMEDFFKKQAEKSKTKLKDVKKPAVNTSIQLFEDDEVEEPEEISSDEEEKLEALKRDIISSDVEMEEEDDEKPSTSAKRRRILDSDDDEDPPVKQEKLDIKEQSNEEEAVAETYLDEDGFVITKKPKQKAKPTNDKSPSTKQTPAVTIKTPRENKKLATASSKDSKPAPNPATKTKQAGIMNFFSKK